MSIMSAAGSEIVNTANSFVVECAGSIKAALRSAGVENNECRIAHSKAGCFSCVITGGIQKAESEKTAFGGQFTIPQKSFRWNNADKSGLILRPIRLLDFPERYNDDAIISTRVENIVKHFGEN